MNYELRIKKNTDTKKEREERVHNSLFLIHYFRRPAMTGRRGFVLALSVIMLSVMLAASLSVFSMIYQGMKLSGTTRDSQMAFYAADAGVECALYVDRVATNGFGKTTEPSVATECATSIPDSYNLQSLNDSYSNGATFTINYGNGSCVDVTVAKSSQTVISSVGRSPCDAPAEKQVNRSLEVKY